MRAQSGAEGILLGDVKKIAVTLTVSKRRHGHRRAALDSKAANSLGKCLLTAHQGAGSSGRRRRHVPHLALHSRLAAAAQRFASSSATSARISRRRLDLLERRVEPERQRHHARVGRQADRLERRRRLALAARRTPSPSRCRRRGSPAPCAARPPGRRRSRARGCAARAADRARAGGTRRRARSSDRVTRPASSSQRVRAVAQRRRRARSAASPRPAAPGASCVPPRSPRCWPPPTHSGSSVAPVAQPQRADALGAVQLVAGDRDRVGAERVRRRARPCRAPARRRRGCGSRARARGPRAAIAAIGCTTPISFCTITIATTAAPTARLGDRVGIDHAVGPGRDARRPRGPPPPSDRAPRRDRRVLDRRDTIVPVLRARGAEHRERVGLGAAARPHDVAVRRRVAERREQAPRARSRCGARAAAPCGCCALGLPHAVRITSVIRASTSSATRVEAALSR